VCLPAVPRPAASAPPAPRLRSSLRSRWVAAGFLVARLAAGQPGIERTARREQRNPRNVTFAKESERRKSIKSTQKPADRKHDWKMLSITDTLLLAEKHHANFTLLSLNKNPTAMEREPPFHLPHRTSRPSDR